jgi:hypothetical protein
MSFGGGATGGRYPAYTWGLLMNSWARQFPITSFPAPESRSGGECLKMPGQESCYGHRAYRDEDGDRIDYNTGTVPFPSSNSETGNGESGGR